MTKEKLYQKAQALFPSELAVGDVVEVTTKEYFKPENFYPDAYDNVRRQYKILKYNEVLNDDGSITHFFVTDSVHNQNSIICEEEDVKLIRKNITLSMLLEKMREKLILCNSDYANSQSGEGAKRILVINECKRKEDELMLFWQLRKDGKDLSLYDQSEETIKFIYEVLK